MNIYIYIYIYIYWQHFFINTDLVEHTYLALTGPAGIRAGWGIEINGSFEAERPPPLRLGHLWVGELLH